MGRRQHRFHGDPERFVVVAEYINRLYGNSIDYIADVAGGQGLLSRILCKKYNYHSEVIDPRVKSLKGVPHRIEEFHSSMASYYDLIVGLHPDEALRPVAESASIRPVVLIPCCNFWSDEKLSQEELLEAIESHYRSLQVSFDRVMFGFSGPKNIGIVSRPSGFP
jgi:hypothetical protein